MKTCNKCDQSKPLSDYHKNKKTKDGHAHYCKSCMLALKKKIKDDYNKIMFEKLRLRDEYEELQ